VDYKFADWIIVAEEELKNIFYFIFDKLLLCFFTCDVYSFICCYISVKIKIQCLLFCFIWNCLCNKFTVNFFRGTTYQNSCSAVLTGFKALKLYDLQQILIQVILLTTIILLYLLCSGDFVRKWLIMMNLQVMMEQERPMVVLAQHIVHLSLWKSCSISSNCCIMMTVFVDSLD